MSSFINKFLGFIKNIVAGRKKESPEPEIILESETQPLQENTQEEKVPEQEIQEMTPEPEPQESEPEPAPEPEPELPAPKPKCRDEYDYTQIQQAIRNIITQHYGYYGFTIADTRGYERFRTYARNYDIAIPESDDELRRLIVCSGTLIDGTVYVFDSEDVNMMLCEAQRLIDDGACVIYFRNLESFLDDSNQYYNLSSRRAVREILRDNYKEYVFTDLYMEISSEGRKFRSYMDGLKYVLSKYFPEGFKSDYALLREYAAKENIILSGNDKALKRETEALLIK